MKIEVVKVVEVAGKTVIDFHSSTGNSRGVWIGDDAPVIGFKIDVEIDLDEPMIKGSNASLIADNKCNHITLGKNLLVEIKGQIESIDDDGMAYLRLAADCLIMIESEGFKTGDFVLLKADPNNFEITPTGC